MDDLNRPGGKSKIREAEDLDIASAKNLEALRGAASNGFERSKRDTLIKEYGSMNDESNDSIAEAKNAKAKNARDDVKPGAGSSWAMDLEEAAFQRHRKRKEAQRAQRAMGTRYNAIKGGLHSNALTPDEDPQVIEEMYDKLCKELGAKGELEKLLLRDFVSFDLRASRIARHESTVLRARLYGIKTREEFCAAAGLQPQQAYEIPDYYIEMDRVSMMRISKIEEAVENLIEIISAVKLEEERLASRGEGSPHSKQEVSTGTGHGLHAEWESIDVSNLSCSLAWHIFPEVWETFFEDQRSAEPGSFMRTLSSKYIGHTDSKILTQFKKEVFDQLFYEVNWLMHKERYLLISKGIQASCALSALSDPNTRRAEAQLNRRKMESFSAFDAAQKRRLANETD